MAPKNVFAAVICICATLLVCNAASATDAYKPNEFLNLDLSTAALSPKPLGPASGFTPVPAETKADPSGAEAQARLEPKVEPHIKAKHNIVARSASIVHTRTATPRGAARTRLARRHTNPLDAQAFDTRI